METTLSKLTGLDDEECNEVCAQKWIQNMLTKNQVFLVVAMNAITNWTNFEASTQQKVSSQM